MDNAKLNGRAIVFYFLFFSVLILPISGILLHITHENDSEKIEYISMAFHNLAAIIFTISSVMHVRYNWRPILNYLKKQKHRSIRYPREIIITGTTIVVLMGLLMIHFLQNHR